MDNATMMELLRQLLEIDLKNVFLSDDVLVGNPYTNGTIVLFPAQFPAANDTTLIYGQDFPLVRNFFAARGLKQLACLKCVALPCLEHRAPGCLPSKFVCGLRCVGGVTLGVTMMVVCGVLFIVLGRVAAKLDTVYDGEPFRLGPRKRTQEQKFAHLEQQRICLERVMVLSKY